MILCSIAEVIFSNSCIITWGHKLSSSMPLIAADSSEDLVFDHNIPGLIPCHVGLLY